MNIAVTLSKNMMLFFTKTEKLRIIVAKRNILKESRNLIEVRRNNRLAPKRNISSFKKISS